MPLSWNEIRQRSITFARHWSAASRERAESQTFWNEFFEVFGVRRRVVASFEEPVKSLTGDTEFIDLFWKGRLIAEHKSRGGDLSKAHTQAVGYIQNLTRNKRQEEAPRYILVSDFARFALHDLEEPDPSKQTVEFNLAKLPDHIRRFAFIAGYETRRVDAEDPVNIKAVELLGNLHDHLEEGGYTGHDLQRFMVRILFCLFADDTGIFEPDSFKLFIQNRTHGDGSDLGPQLACFFSVLNTPAERRQKNLDEDLAALPYVNGDLFAENLSFAEFSTAMRNALTTCCNFRWEKISPAVFGSLFQSIMEDKQRRQIGAHYTSERDIMKLTRSLFLDDLRAEFDSVRRDKKKLKEFHRRLGELRFLDPACGCGNFLVIAYRELRRLELDVLQARFGKEPDEADIRAECRLNVGQMYGIEIEEWPVRIAEVALWLMDHQMNAELFERFGQVKATTPLKSSPTIRHANALRIDWNEVLPAKDCSYVLGNPPFVGKHLLTPEQDADMSAVWGDINGAGFLDYVTGWYLTAANYIGATAIKVGFVSTNSITQGEQVGVLWSELFRRGMKIHFGHRTFPWESEARGKAHVHVVLIGFANFDVPEKRIYSYDFDPERPSITTVRNLSPYLVEGSDLALPIRRSPICSVPEIVNGNKPADGGFLIIEGEERDAFLARNPSAAPYVKPFLCAEQYLNGEQRWVLWLLDAPPEVVRDNKDILERVSKVREFRMQSKKESTRNRATRPALFDQIRQPSHEYIVIPRHSSETRRYIPFGYFDPEVIIGDSCTAIPNATLYHFGVLSSEMHMAWMRQVCGRLKSDCRYSNKLVYNNYPWPAEVSEAKKRHVEEAAQGVLDARAKYPNSTLADLYDPVSMPAPLAKAHTELDRAVDRCYRSQPFDSERHRVEYLFNLYEQLTAPLVPVAKGRRKKAKAG